MTLQASPQFPTQWTPKCPVCHLSVPLETSKTDANGNAIHDHCYLFTLNREHEKTVRRIPHLIERNRRRICSHCGTAFDGDGETSISTAFAAHVQAAHTQAAPRQKDHGGPESAGAERKEPEKS
jgi:hypothetical protein